MKDPSDRIGGRASQSLSTALTSSRGGKNHRSRSRSRDRNVNGGRHDRQPQTQDHYPEERYGSVQSQRFQSDCRSSLTKGLDKPSPSSIQRNEDKSNFPMSDLKLQDIIDPRVQSNGTPCSLRTSKPRVSGAGRNTASFDPSSTYVRPDMRIKIGKLSDPICPQLTHDDVLIIPNFLADEEDWSLYYKLLEEMKACQSADVNGSEWISWHEGAHLISQNPTGSSTYQIIQEKISKYFNIPNNSVGTRFNWYKDSSDWKPYHHDSAAFNPTRGNIIINELM